MRRTSSFALAVLGVLCPFVAGSILLLSWGASDVGKESIAIAQFPGAFQAERSVRTSFFQDRCLLEKEASLVYAHSWFVSFSSSC